MTVFTLVAPVQAETVRRNSRFFAFVVPVEDRAQALDLRDSLRREHPEARHVCWAFFAGGQAGMSDDGEPPGTAGRPILEVLRRQELEGVFAGVVRYFGGMKLGANHLARAYAASVAAALRQASRQERLPKIELSVETDYAYGERVRYTLAQREVELLDCQYGASIRLRIRIPLEHEATVRSLLAECSAGRSRVSGVDGVVAVSAVPQEQHSIAPRPARNGEESCGW